MSANVGGYCNLEDYFDFLSPHDIRVRGSRIGIETIIPIAPVPATWPPGAIALLLGTPVPPNASTVLCRLRVPPCGPSVRSQLVKEVLAYLDALAVRAAELPADYSAHLYMDETGQTRFDAIRQRVQVVEDRAAFERWRAEERERLRAAGIDFDRLAYYPIRSGRCLLRLTV